MSILCKKLFHSIGPWAQRLCLFTFITKCIRAFLPVGIHLMIVILHASLFKKCFFIVTDTFTHIENFFLWRNFAKMLVKLSQSLVSAKVVRPKVVRPKSVRPKSVRPLCQTKLVFDFNVVRPRSSTKDDCLGKHIDCIWSRIYTLVSLH